MTRVAHFCTFPHGGAAAAARRIHHSLATTNVESQFYFHRNQKQVPLDDSYSQIEFEPTKHGLLTGVVTRRLEKRRQKRIYSLFNRDLAVRPEQAETFSMAELPDPTVLPWKEIQADIVHLHWISYFADYESFFGSIPKSVPIVWSLHDTNTFTGGCHYTSSCTQFRFGCGHCPQLVQHRRDDVSRVSFEAKKRALAGRNVRVVAPCDWMLDLAQQSGVWPKATQFQKLEYGLDLINEFPTVERASREQARKELGLSGETPVIAFGAMDVENPRKGFQHLLPALERLAESNPSVKSLAFGSGDLSALAANCTTQPKIEELGFVSCEKKKRNIYLAADLVVVPSVEDNQPQVGLEAMACGTPVVAFDATGMPEYVIDGETGVLVPVGDEVALANAIASLLKDRARLSELGNNARKLVEDRFDDQQKSRKWLELYDGLVARSALKRAA